MLESDSAALHFAKLRACHARITRRWTRHARGWSAIHLHERHLHHNRSLYRFVVALQLHQFPMFAIVAAKMQRCLGSWRPRVACIVGDVYVGIISAERTQNRVWVCIHLQALIFMHSMRIYFVFGKSRCIADIFNTVRFIEIDTLCCDAARCVRMQCVLQDVVFCLQWSTWNCKIKCCGIFSNFSVSPWQRQRKVQWRQGKAPWRQWRAQWKQWRIRASLNCVRLISNFAL